MPITSKFVPYSQAGEIKLAAYREGSQAALVVSTWNGSFPPQAIQMSISDPSGEISLPNYWFSALGNLINYGHLLVTARLNHEGVNAFSLDVDVQMNVTLGEQLEPAGTVGASYTMVLQYPDDSPLNKEATRP